MSITKQSLAEFEERMGWLERCTEAEDVLNIISRRIDKKYGENKCNCKVFEEACKHEYKLHETMTTISDAIKLIRKWSF